MTRGRLINPFIARIARLDTAATLAYDPSGPATSGYDPEFQEPTLEDVGDAVGVPVRVESTSIDLRCQVEPGSFEAQRESFSGDIPETEIALVFHFCDLEKSGLVDINGEPGLRKGARLEAIFKCRNGVAAGLVQRFDPGLYAVEVRSLAFGLGLSRNLLFVRFTDRELGDLRAG